MKTQVFLAAFASLIIANNLTAQNVGINSTGATPNASAQLDLNTGNTFTSPNGRGLLVPNVALTSTSDAATVSSPATSLFVYNTATASSGSTAVIPGFYYWDGAKWVAFTGGGSKNWSLTGNAGTTASTSSNTVTVNNNFIGTTDNVDFVVATNNLEVARFFKSPTENMVVNSTTAVTNDIFSSYSPTASGNAIAGYHTYTGTSGGNGVYGTTSADNGNGVKGKSTTVTTSTTVIPTGVYGQAAAQHGIGVYGQNTNTSGTGVVGAGNGLASLVLSGGSGGSFSSTNVGAYGYADATSNSWGVYGKSLSVDGIGVYGLSAGTAGSSSGIGVAGTTNQTGGAGVAGYIGTGVSWFPGVGTSGIGAGTVGSAGVFGQTTAAASGTSYGLTTMNVGVGGQYLGNKSYSFGLAGQSDPAQSTKRTGGAIGIQGTGLAWGSLGYYSSGSTNYGVYAGVAAGSIAGGAGRMASSAANTSSLSNDVQNGIAIGGFGGVMGGWVRSNVLGFTACGELYASYNLGNSYTSGHSAEIVTLSDKRVAAYPVTSTDIKIYSDGSSQLMNGRARVNFEQQFTELIGNNKPIVTITPMGQCNGIYIANVDLKGFDVIEMNNGNSSVEFSYITIGKRLDSSAQLPEALAAKDFDTNLKGIMINENDLNQTATPIWWDGKILHFEGTPNTKTEGVLKAMPSINNNTITNKETK